MWEYLPGNKKISTFNKQIYSEPIQKQSVNNNTIVYAGQHEDQNATNTFAYYKNLNNLPDLL